jgi:hypothetical protein
MRPSEEYLTSMTSKDIMLGELLDNLTFRLLKYLCFVQSVNDKPKHEATVEHIKNRMQGFLSSWKSIHDMMDACKNSDETEAKIQVLQDQLEVELLLASVSLATFGKIDDSKVSPSKLDQVVLGTTWCVEPFILETLQLFVTSHPEYHRELCDFWSEWVVDFFTTAKRVTSLVHFSSQITPPWLIHDTPHSNFTLLQVFCFWFRASLRLVHLQIEELSYKPSARNGSKANRKLSLIGLPLEQKIKSALKKLSPCKSYIKQQLDLYHEDTNGFDIHAVPIAFLSDEVFVLLDNHETERIECQKMFTSLINTL